MECLGLALRVLGSGAAATVTEERLGMSHQLLLPVLDLIGVNVEVLGELGQGSVPSHGCHRYLRLEARRMIASFPLGHLLLLFLDGNVVQKIPLSSVDQLSNRWGPPLPRQPEVQHLHRTVVTHLDVGRFQIPVDDPLLVCCFEGFGDLLSNRQRLVERDSASFDAVSQRRPFDEFQNQRPDAVSFLQAVDVADVRVIQRSQNLCLTLEPRESFWVSRERFRQDLERHLALELGIRRLIDLPHPTLADEGGHVVAPYALESHVVRPETEEVIAAAQVRA